MLNSPVSQLKNPDFLPLFKFWNQLSKSDRQYLLNQIEAIDLSLLKKQKSLLSHFPFNIEKRFDPFLDYHYVGSQQDEQIGKEYIAEGRLGCLLLAGGQGSRLQFDNPKGMYPVSIIKHKTLFQIFAEKTLAAGKQAGRPLFLAIMTSPQNDETTRTFFAQSQFFGLNPEQIFFFSQGSLPLLDKQGGLFLEASNRVALGPNGNGFCLKDFVKAGIADKWNQQGVQYIQTVLIDNPLANPFDSELLGFHLRQSVDITIKCIEKQHPEEKVGVVVKEGHHCRVVEYSELSESEKTALSDDGRLKHRCANLSLFCFSMNFIQSINHQDYDLQLHPNWKAVKYADEKGHTCLSKIPNAWKFESFIFDILTYTTRIAALLYPRHECFAPLKNLTGSDSLEHVQASLQNKERQIIEKLTGLPAPLTPFELAPDFYYPTPELISKWTGKMIKEDYIEP